MTDYTHLASFISSLLVGPERIDCLSRAWLLGRQSTCTNHAKIFKMIKHAEERKHEVLLTTQSETLPEIAHIVKNILAVHNYFPMRWSEQPCKTTNTINWRKMAAQGIYNAQEWELGQGEILPYRRANIKTRRSFLKLNLPLYSIWL